jgi:ATP-dependent RNA helicase DeaD
MSTQFAQLGLEGSLLEAATRAGFTSPTPIQERAIPVMLAGRHMVGQAQTGTGKTAAYGFPLLQMVEAQGPIQALVLVPTRELALQVTEQFHQWAPHIRTVAIYGGQSIVVQFKALRQGAQILVATPGRLIDHLDRQSLSLDHLHYCVLDEADEMLDFGFEEAIEMILAHRPESCRMALFSATFPDRIKRLTQRHLPEAERIEIMPKERTVSTIAQFYCLVKKARKAQTVGRLLDYYDPGPTLIFCKTRQDTVQLTEHLRAHGYAAECLNGEMDQSERERVMDRFRQNQCRLLVATDIAARGLDVDGITHVVNFDIPWDVEQYIHRVGRTARAGRSGVSVTLIEPAQLRFLQKLEREAGAAIRPQAIPTPDEVQAGRHKRLAERLRIQLADPRCQEQLPLARALAKQADPLAVAAAALQLVWDQIYAPPAQAEVVEEDLTPAAPQGDYAWVSLSVGAREGIRPAEVLRTLQDETGLVKHELGKIRIEETVTMVQVPTHKAQTTIASLRRVRVKGKRLKVDLGRPAKQWDAKPRRPRR